jgi:hypothetical protein
MRSARVEQRLSPKLGFDDVPGSTVDMFLSG